MNKVLLLVENYPAYRELGKRVLQEETGMQVVCKSDSRSALEFLESGVPNAVVSDIFLEQEEGSSLRDSGRFLLRELRNSDPRERLLYRLQKFFNHHIPRSEQRHCLRQQLETYAYTFADRKEEPPWTGWKQCLRNWPTPIAQDIIMGTLNCHAGSDPVKGSFFHLWAALEGDALNAPLGLLVMRDAKRMGIPAAVASDTYHHDMELVLAEIQESGYHTVEYLGPNAKEQKEFWELASRGIRLVMRNHERISCDESVKERKRERA